MKNNNKRDVSKGIAEDSINKRVELPITFYVYLNCFIFVLCSYPSMLIFFYYPQVMQWIHMDSLFGIISPTLFGIQYFWIIFFLPIPIIFAILSFIISVTYVSSFFVKYWNKKSPPSEGTYKREFGGGHTAGKDGLFIKYYHYRGFIIKFPIWLAAKSPFRWLQIWVLKKVGHNQIMDAIIIDAFPGLENFQMDDNVILYPGSAASSHIVDSIFGNLSIIKIIMKENSSIMPNSILGPGAHIEIGDTIMPNSMTHKNWRGKEGMHFYSGPPAKTIDTIYSGIFSQLPKDVLESYQQNGYYTFSN